jgi:hypothetical protein
MKAVKERVAMHGVVVEEQQDVQARAVAGYG